MAARRFIYNCCCKIFAETKLDSTTPDAAIELVGHTAYQADRAADSDKQSGGGLCIYINNSWCTNVTVVSKLCSPVGEIMLLKCRPFYLPREFTAVYVCAVYIPPNVNIKLALTQLYDCNNNSLVGHPGSVFIAAGDFNHADLKSVLHKFHRNVKCVTKEMTFWTKFIQMWRMANAYRAQVCAHMGRLGHLCVVIPTVYT